MACRRPRSRAGAGALICDLRTQPVARAAGEVKGVVSGKSVPRGARRTINDTATTEIYTLSLHDVSISVVAVSSDRKSTRLNSTHTLISHAVFCLTKIE